MFRIRNLFQKRSRADQPYYAFLRHAYGIIPANIDLYKLALLHRSASVALGDGRTVNNERLEFLGDAVIQAIVSELLFIEYPDANEGFLSKLRSRIVSRATLNRLALEIGLGNELIAHPSNLGGHRQNLYGDAFEALIGALYLDQGYNRTNRILIDRIFALHLDLESLGHTEQDFKSRIIEWGQKQHVSVEFQSHPCGDHTEMSPHFETRLLVGGIQQGYGESRSKKEAEQQAACAAYEQLTAPKEEVAASEEKN